MLNAKHDTEHYDADISRNGYTREIYDGNVLYESYLKAKKGSDWKPQVQKFEQSYILEIARIQKELKNKTYDFLPTNNFTISERGKTRRITGEQIQDRIVKHALCDENLNPSIEKFLIYDNGASQKGKGIDFTRSRVEKHLRKFYRKHGNNGYVLIMDFSKYYDNIRHNDLLEMFKKYVEDETALWLLEKIIKRSEVDVSYMNDEEYSNCMNTLFNSLDYQCIDKKLLTKEKFMKKHLSIGDQVAQTAGISYRMEIDNFCKIVKGCKYYDGYMDDTLIIHESKDFLKDLLKDIINVANMKGITVNLKKTKIVKLSSKWKFLQTTYSLTDTGRIVMKINKRRVRDTRRKIKKLAPKMTTKQFKDWYNSVFKNAYKRMSKQQRHNLDILYKEKLKCTL